MASRMARRLYLGGRPPGLSAGTNGPRMAHNSSVRRSGKTVMRDIRVGFMLDKITLTDQRIQDYFPNRLLEFSASAVASGLGRQSAQLVVDWRQKLLGGAWIA